MSMRVRVGDRVAEIAARRTPGEDKVFSVWIDDEERSVRATVLPDGAFLLDLGDGRQSRARVTRDGDARWVTVAGRTALLHRVEAESGAVDEAGGLLEAPMPGKVVAISVEVGDSVSAGDALLVVEAMKMEHPIRAPHDGVVSAVNAEVGEMVSPGTALISLEEDG